jgi:hypothetical protein
MDGIADLVRETGIKLGGPNRYLPARVDFWRLRWSVEKSDVLTVVYGNSNVGVSTTICEKFDSFKLIRNSPIVETCEYYAVPKKVFNV